MSEAELNRLINKCRSAGGETMWECIKRAKEKVARSEPNTKDSIYPWINYDWDYTTFIDNNYSSDKTGATPSGNWDAMFKNPMAMFKLGKGFIIDPNPAGNSQAGSDDQLDCNAVPEMNRASCQVIRDIRQSYRSQPKPKNTPFFNKPTGGKASSSFYYQSGYCESKKNTNEIMCNANGGKWYTDKCYKPRYAYIKNEPGMDFTKLGDNSLLKLANTMGGYLQGNIPSAMGDVLSFSPNNLIDIIDQKDTKDFMLEPCTENFVDYLPSLKNNFIDSPTKLVFICFIITIVLALLSIFLIK